MVMPCQAIERAIFGQVPMLAPRDRKFPITADQIQPASFDFRLGNIAYRMKSAAIPDNETVDELIAKYKKYEFELDPQSGKCLEVGMTYIVPLMEQCAFPSDTWVDFTAKSSTGRCDIFARVLGNCRDYDRLPKGYRGPVFVELTPLSHDVMVAEGLSLVQGRFKTDATQAVPRPELERLHMREAIVFDAGGEPMATKELDFAGDHLYFHVDLARDVVGFVAKATTSSINMMDKESHEPYDFWEPIRRPRDGQLVLLPGKFYLLATKERVRIPAECCGQVQDYDTKSGEIRPHYAGFFDNGFGGKQGTNGVLEVRAREVPFRIRDGQRICAMRFERTHEVPNKLYGGNYDNPGPSLSKHFKHRYDVWHTGYWSQW